MGFPESVTFSQTKYGVRASFVIAVLFAFLASIFLLIGFVSPYWIVAKKGNNLGFVRLGLWEVCFQDFIFPEDYVSKAYQGCWYIYYPEYKYIRFWLNPPWLFAVQILSIIGLICSLSGLLVIILILCEIYGTRERKPKLTVIALEILTLCCLIVVTVSMGAMSKDRQWLPRSDMNRVSWSFAFVVISGFFTIFCLFGLVTHYLSVESRIMMEDPVLREKLLSQEFTRDYHKSVSGFGGAPGTESGKGVPSLFTMPITGSHIGPASTMFAAGTASGLSRATVAPGAVGTAAQGTSAANVSAKLRLTLEAQRAAVLAATSRNVGDTVPVSTSGQGQSTSLRRQYNPAMARGSSAQLHTSLTMDSNV